MADPIYIMTQAKYDEGGSNPPSLIFDSVTSFVPNFSKRMTQYSLSDKSSITNHNIKDNVTISMTAIVTSAPLTKYNNNLAGYTDFSERPKSAYDILYSWWNSDTDLFIDEGNRQFTKMQITSLEPFEEGFDSIKFNVKFEKARRVGYQRVTLVANMNDSKSKDGSPTTSKKGETSEERTSQLKLLLDDFIQGSGDLTDNSYIKNLNDTGVGEE